MKIISQAELNGKMFVTLTPRGLLLNTKLERALGTKGQKESFLTLAVDDNKHLAFKKGEKNEDSFRACRYGNALMITRVLRLCPPLSSGKAVRFPVKKVGEWYVTEMNVTL